MSGREKDDPKAKRMKTRNLRRSLRRTGLAVSLVIPLTMVACARIPPVRSATGATSKTLCTAVFVSGLDADQSYAEMLKPAPAMRLLDAILQYRVDRPRREVTSTIAGGFENRALYRDGLGCILVNDRSQRIAAETFSFSNQEILPPDLPEVAGPKIVDAANETMKAALDRAFREREEAPYHWTKAVVVVRDGRILAERYAPGYGVDTPLPGNSLTKSALNALIGILVRKGKLGVDQPAPIPAWHSSNDPRHAITIDQLLRMTSGLPWDEPALRMWYAEADMESYAQNLPLESMPGREWRYSNAGYQILSRIVRDAVGGSAKDVLQFAYRELFIPLGMRRVTVSFDATDTPVGSNGMLATARDWARLGVLYLHDGVAGSKRILPEGWARYSASQTLDTGYGAGFWLNLVDRRIPRFDIPWGMADAPRDAFFARGYLGQYLVVIPSKRLVIARLGVSHERGGDVESVGRLVADVIGGLD
jgi:CubicO group peptidase (beta-lactamase class C family)